MKNYFSVINHGIVVCLVSVLSSSANPNPPTAYPILSEIQVTDSLHWNVEVDVRTYPAVGLNTPCTTTAFSLFCWQSTSQPPRDSMRLPVKMEQFDTKGIAVLTQQDFPKVKLIKGATVFLRYKYTYYDGDSVFYTWQTQIPADLVPQQSVKGSLEMRCIAIQCPMPSPVAVYSVSNSPSIGLPNSFTSVLSQKNAPPTANSVRLLSPKIRGQIPMVVSGTFSGKGTIDIFTADGSLIRLLSFACNGPGTYTISWDGNNEQGRTIPAGTYVCRVKLGEEVSCKGFIVW